MNEICLRRRGIHILEQQSCPIHLSYRTTCFLRIPLPIGPGEKSVHTVVSRLRSGQYPTERPFVQNLLESNEVSFMASTLISVDVPSCAACGTDQYLAYEDFIPARTLPTGAVVPPSVNYTCTKCEHYSGHGVPEGWEPPGWFWYS